MESYLTLIKQVSVRDIDEQFDSITETDRVLWWQSACKLFKNEFIVGKNIYDEKYRAYILMVILDAMFELGIDGYPDYILYLRANEIVVEDSLLFDAAILLVEFRWLLGLGEVD